MGRKTRCSDWLTLYRRCLWDVHMELLERNSDMESRVRERGLG